MHVAEEPGLEAACLLQADARNGSNTRQGTLEAPCEYDSAAGLEPTPLHSAVIEK